MPSKRSALKHMRSDQKKHERNKAVKSELRTLDKKYNIMISSGNLEEASEFLKKIAKKFDKSASKGIIHENKADRKKSRLTLKLKKALKEEKES